MIQWEAWILRFLLSENISDQWWFFVLLSSYVLLLQSRLIIFWKFWVRCSWLMLLLICNCCRSSPVCWSLCTCNSHSMIILWLLIRLLLLQHLISSLVLLIAHFLLNVLKVVHSWLVALTHATILFSTVNALKPLLWLSMLLVAIVDSRHLNCAIVRCIQL